MGREFLAASRSSENSLNEATADRLRAARQVHEIYCVPIGLIAVLTRRKPDHLERYAAKEGWRMDAPIPHLLHQLVDASNALIGLIVSTDDEKREPEKEARALTVLAKTAESLLLLKEKLGAPVSAARQQPVKETDEKTSLDEPDALQLCEQLEGLVSGLGEKRSAAEGSRKAGAEKTRGAG